ncbi:hypothetical protein [Sphingomonas ginkgonis]|uniref:hypothetical protein n=1 Tax=Sphingomonas ginkgonis TaxID=2315330 RepID=UPI0026C3D3C7
MKRLLPAAALIALAGCGRVNDLQPAPGHALPVRPKFATVTPTPTDLLTAPPYARPHRVDELEGVGERRRADRFDLPPPDGGAAPQPQTATQVQPSTDDPGPVTPR